MTRNFVLASIVSVLTLTTVANASQPKPEKLGKQQLASLVATAKTPAQHSRIAQYYATKAQDDLAQAKAHAQMAAQFKQNPATNSAKFATGTVNHCEYLTQHLNNEARKMQALAEEHEKMARAAE